MGIVSVAMPLYAVSLHLSLVDITMLLAVSDAVALLLKPFMAGVADHWGFSRTLTLAIAPRSLLCLGYGFAAVPWHLYAVRSGHGLTDSLRDPPVNTLMAEHGGSKAVARSFAWYQTAKTFAASTGRGAALAQLADKVDHRLVLSFRSVANTLSSLSYAAFPF